MSKAAGEITWETLPERALPLASEPRLRRDGRTARVVYRNEIPYFWWMWTLPLRVRARRIERAAAAGRPLPLSAPFWAPPVAMDAAAISTVSVVCLYTLCLGYAGGTGGLLTNTLPYASDLFGASDHALGVGLAVVRVGVIVAFALGLIADRRGRRALIVAGALLHCGLAAVLGLAPTFESYIAGHTVLRALDAGLSVALVVIAVEAVPAANRAVTLSLVFLATGTGVALGVMALPLASAGRAGFAATYGLQLVAVPFLLGAARLLPESARFSAETGSRGDWRELLWGTLRRRMLTVGASTFLSAIFVAPMIEFLTQYLDEVHDYSPTQIVALGAAGAVFAVPALGAGAQAADRFGRRVVGLPLGTLALLLFAGFLLTGGPLMWVCFCLGAAAFSGSGAALAAYGPELFPTRLRATANGALAVIGVVGSAIGLITVGVLSDPLGLGHALALLAAFPLLALLIVWRTFPETARRELEATSAV